MQAKSDAQLLREYVERGSEAAFGEIVARHTDLVYSAALRQIALPDLARDITQSVFTDLASKARFLARRQAEDGSLAGWLYRGTRYAALTLLRDERRRQSRERQVMEDFNPAPDTSPDWDRVRPILDEAMAHLSDEDRDVLLLRFFKNQDFRAVGLAIGASDDAAQKRVSRALERLRAFLTRRGVTTTTVGAIAAVLSANAVQAAPAGLATALAGASLAGAAAGTGASLTLVELMTMTKLKVGIIGAIVAAGVATPLAIQRQAAVKLRGENQALQQQVEQLTPLLAETGRLSSVVAQAENTQAQLNDQLLKLRDETVKLRAENKRLAEPRSGAQAAADPFTQSLLAMADRAGELNQHLNQMPDKRIPELQCLTENDWLSAASEASFGSDAEIRKALSRLRELAKRRFSNLLCHALDEYLKANDGQLPDTLFQLKPYFNVPVEDAVLQRYRMLHTGYVTNLPPGTEFVISEKAPVDRDYDSHFYMGPHGRSGSWGTGKDSRGDPDETWAAQAQP